MGALGAIVLAIIVRLVAGDTMSVHVSQPNAEMYHRQDMKRGEFDYGYHVQTVNNQFQHKVKGPDDVTYGCYGYVDPSNRKHLVYYVADRMGYRIIFPNRATKIFSAKLSDSLNKLDGAVKGKDYDERLVEWNDLYLPESCFRLDEILDTAASNQPTPQKVVPAHVPVNPTPELPRPTQYTIPTTPRTVLDQTRPANTQRTVDYDYDGEQQSVNGGGTYVNVGQRQGGNQQQSGGQQQPQPAWQGSLPDINPASINLDQFNGLVYPLQPATPEQLGGGIHTQTSTSQFSGSQNSLNITQLLAQIDAVNSQVITMNMLLAGMAQNPIAYANANENSCRSVVQLLTTQKRTPQLVYVPILIPYTEGQYNVNQPIVPVRSDAYQHASKTHHGRG